MADTYQPTGPIYGIGISDPQKTGIEPGPAYPGGRISRTTDQDNPAWKPVAGGQTQTPQPPKQTGLAFIQQAQRQNAEEVAELLQLVIGLVDLLQGPRPKCEGVSVLTGEAQTAGVINQIAESLGEEASDLGYLKAELRRLEELL